MLRAQAVATTRRLLRPAAYGAVGVLNTVVDFLVFWALLDLMPALLANVISFSVGAVNSLVLNSFVTFHDRKAEIVYPIGLALVLFAAQSASLWGGLPLFVRTILTASVAKMRISIPLTIS